MDESFQQPGNNFFRFYRALSSRFENIKTSEMQTTSSLRQVRIRHAKSAFTPESHRSLAQVWRLREIKRDWRRKGGQLECRRSDGVGTHFALDVTSSRFFVEVRVR